MKAWEYELFIIDANTSESKFKENLGNKGWEIYQREFHSDHNVVSIYCKRPKTHELFSLLRHMIEYYYENGGINRELMVRLDDMIEG